MLQYMRFEQIHSILVVKKNNTATHINLALNRLHKNSLIKAYTAVNNVSRLVCYNLMRLREVTVSL